MRMWNLAKGKQFLPEVSLRQLKTMYAQEKKAKQNYDCWELFSVNKQKVSMKSRTCLILLAIQYMGGFGDSCTEALVQKTASSKQADRQK